jgi:hypothetical protein
MLNIFQTPVFKIQATNSKHFNALCICGHHAYFLVSINSVLFPIECLKKEISSEIKFSFHNILFTF